MILYTDIDAFCCQWLENLVVAGYLPKGDVLCADIKKIKARDVRKYHQIHWFCGIGGWPLALKMAGWPEEEVVHTGSCPCQPFSVAGKRKGEADERHLWPFWRPLVAQLRPPTVFGEQVASKDGRVWLSRVRVDLEALGYACGAADLCAAGVAAHHIRSRLFWMASTNANCYRRKRQRICEERPWSKKQFERLVQNQLQVSVSSGKSGGVHDGVYARASKLRAYGNSIVPQVAAEFVAACREALADQGRLNGR